MLSWAAEEGHLCGVRTLLECGVVTADSEDIRGMTPLWLAIAVGHGATVQLLVEKGADIDAANGDGQTPPSLAAENSMKQWF